MMVIHEVSLFTLLTVSLFGFSFQDPTEQPKKVCYGDLGCFSTEGIFSHFVLPMSPTDIGTKFDCYTRHNHAAVNAGQTSGFHACSYSATKKTYIIVHGYMNTISTKWLTDLKNALLKQEDANVIIVSWGPGAHTGYFLAAANTIVVGAQVHKLLTYLHSSFHLSYSNVHLIGHSLGAHACGYAGSLARGIGRISGLDPAQPSFQDMDIKVRLDPSDALFIDVIHTDATKFVGIAGFGTTKPCGHVDFFPNGGNSQPGCTEKQLVGAIEDILNGHVHAAAQDVSCSHSRAHDYFLHTVNQNGCSLKGHTCSSYGDFEAGKCLSCSHGACPAMGFQAKSSDHHGTYYLNTMEKEPYCGISYFVEIKLASKMWDGYGQIYVELIGAHGQTELLKFNRRAERFHHSLTEHHVLISSKNVGDIHEVKVKYVHEKGLGGLLSVDHLAFHSLTVRNENSSHTAKLCAHDHEVKDNHLLAVFSGSHC